MVTALARRAAACAGTALALLAPIPGLAQAAAGPAGAFTVADGVGFRQIVGDEGGKVNWSPDRRHFTVITARGDIATNSNVYELLLYDVAALKERRTAPRLLDRAASRTNIPGIFAVRWLGTGGISYVRSPGEGPAQLVRSDLAGNRKALTAHPTPVLAYQIAANGETAVIDAAVAPASLDRLSQGIVAGPRAPLELFGDALRFPPFTQREHFRVDLRTGREIPLANVPRYMSFLNFLASGMAISPGGRWAVLQGAEVDELAPMHSPAIFYPRLWLVDLAAAARGAPAAPVDLGLNGSLAEGFAAVKLAWAPGEAALFATRAVRNGPDGALPTLVTRTELPGGRIARIGELPAGTPVTGLAAESADAVIVRGGRSDHRFALRDGRWAMTTAAPAAPPSDELTVRVREDVNTPPDLVARWAGAEFAISDLNPQLRGFDFGGGRAFRWKADDAREWEGVLVMPAGHVPGRRYPLVVQTYRPAPGSFVLDGAGGEIASGYAARAFAARGLMVVLVPRNYDRLNTPDEIPDNARVIRGAVKALVDAGLADPARVGIHGSSRSGLYIQDAMFACDFDVVAASVSEGNEISQLYYVQALGYHGTSDMPANERGAGLPPLFEGDSATIWAARDPTMHLGGVKAALLIQAYANGMGEWWDTYAILRRNRRAAEYVYYPDSAHVPIKPLERLSAQGATVDWYDFWLAGHEDPDPAKAGQYRRWRELRKWREDALARPVDDHYCTKVPR